jgi:protein-disulfide isomerase
LISFGLGPAIVTLLTLVGGTTGIAAGLLDSNRAPTRGNASAGEAPAGAVQQDSDPLLEQRTKGDPAALIKIFEASDFQCPYCRTFVEEILPTLDAEYIQTGKAQLVFVNLPLVDLHPNAAAAHEFAMCAAQQDRFWPAHDLLFRHQESWGGSSKPAEFFLSLIDSVALDRAVLMECVETGALRWLVQAEAVALFQKGIRSTPSFVIDQGLMVGAQSIELWRQVLDSLHVEKTGG